MWLGPSEDHRIFILPKCPSVLHPLPVIDVWGAHRSSSSFPIFSRTCSCGLAAGVFCRDVASSVVSNACKLQQWCARGGLQRDQVSC